MAKYKMKAALIPTLKAAGLVSADDILVIRIPHRIQGTQETVFELSIDVNEAIETDNRRAMSAIESSKSPALKVNGDWIAGDPTVLWFDKLADGDPTTSKQPHVHGEEVLSRNQRKLIKHYAEETGAAVPRSIKKTEMDSHLTNARNHFRP